MERLTKRIGNSIAYSDFNSNNSDGCYESMDKCLHKLADYEDAEEQGLLLRFSCKVGDIVWYVDDDNDKYPLEFEIIQIKIFHNDYVRYFAEGKKSDETILIREDDFGETIFTTKEEAKQALAKMKGE